MIILKTIFNMPEAVLCTLMHKTLKDWNLLPHGIINKTEVSEDPAKTFASIVKGGAKF